MWLGVLEWYWCGVGGCSRIWRQWESLIDSLNNSTNSMCMTWIMCLICILCIGSRFMTAGLALMLNASLAAFHLIPTLCLAAICTVHWAITDKRKICIA